MYFCQLATITQVSTNKFTTHTAIPFKILHLDRVVNAKMARNQT